MGVDGLGLDHVLPVPGLLEQLLAAEHGAGVCHERCQKLELARGELDLLALVGGAVAGLVQMDAGDVEHAGAVLHGVCLLGSAAQQRVDARQKLADAKGLGEVVVAAELEADDLVELRVAGGEEEHGHVARAADAPTDLVAVDAGEHDVEDDQVVVGCLRHGDSLVAGVGHVDLVAFLEQVEADDVGDAFLVIDDEDALLADLFHICLLRKGFVVIRSFCHARCH